MTQMLVFKVEFQAEGAVNASYVQESINQALSRYQDNSGLSRPDDEGMITEFQVSALDGDVLIGGETDLRQRLQALLAEVEEGYDLHHYAARDALQVLARTWLADDKITREDIGEVITILHEVSRKLSTEPSRTLDALRQARASTERVQTLNTMTIEAMHGPLRDALEKATREANSQMDTDQIALGKLIVRETPAAFDLNLIRDLDQGSVLIEELDKLIALAEIGPLTLRDLQNV